MDLGRFPYAGPRFGRAPRTLVGTGSWRRVFWNTRQCIFETWRPRTRSARRSDVRGRGNCSWISRIGSHSHLGKSYDWIPDYEESDRDTTLMAGLDMQEHANNSTPNTDWKASTLIFASYLFMNCPIFVNNSMLSCFWECFITCATHYSPWISSDGTS